MQTADFATLQLTRFIERLVIYVIIDVRENALERHKVKYDLDNIFDFHNMFA